jgi:hypothetical protein
VWRNRVTARLAKSVNTAVPRATSTNTHHGEPLLTTVVVGGESGATPRRLARERA